MAIFAGGPLAPPSFPAATAAAFFGSPDGTGSDAAPVAQVSIALQMALMLEGVEYKLLR
ncbi:MAG: hypothetical protein WB495_26355 [Xanthobacteraceae bacterium]